MEKKAPFPSPLSDKLTQPTPNNLNLWIAIAVVAVIAVLGAVKAWTGTVSPDDLAGLQEPTIQVKQQDGSIKEIPQSKITQDIVNLIQQGNQ